MQGEQSKTSLTDIAQTLLTPAGQPPAVVEVSEDLNDQTGVKSPEEGTSQDDAALAALLVQQDTAVNTSEATTDDDIGADDATDDETGEEVDDATDDAAQDQTIIDIRDDDVIDVMIDGKLVQRSIGELKKAISGEGAIEKRLQEATELRKSAHAERTTMLETLAEQERTVANALVGLEDTVFKAVIPAPDPKMRTTNPAAYLRHKEAFDEDQARITAGKAAIQGKLTEFATKRAARLKEYGDAAAKHIAVLIPELANPQTQTGMLERLVGTAKAYGYTEQEIGAALDPRMFHLVRDAMRYRDLTSRAKETSVMDVSKQGHKVPRKLRSGNTKATAIVAQRAKLNAQSKAKAASTGSVKDVAATLLHTKGK